MYRLRTVSICFCWKRPLLCEGVTSRARARESANADAHNETRRAVHGTGRAQLGKEELDDVLGLALHSLADVRDVGKDAALVAVAVHRWRRNLEQLATASAGQAGV
jgi:hypothetical protein